MGGIGLDRPVAMPGRRVLPVARRSTASRIRRRRGRDLAGFGPRGGPGARTMQCGSEHAPWRANGGACRGPDISISSIPAGYALFCRLCRSCARCGRNAPMSRTTSRPDPPHETFRCARPSSAKISALCSPSAGGGVSTRGPPWANLKAATGTPNSPRNARRAGVAMDHAAARHLRVGDRLAHGAHPRRRHMAGLEELLPLRRRAGLEDIRQHLRFAGVIGLALVVAALDEVGAPEHGPQPALLAQIACTDHQHAVLRLIGAVGRVGVAVAVGLGVGAVAQIAGEMRAHQDHRRRRASPCRSLAAAGALALEQRRRQRERAGGAGRVIPQAGSPGGIPRGPCP